MIKFVFGNDELVRYEFWLVFHVDKNRQKTMRYSIIYLKVEKIQMLKSKRHATSYIQLSGNGQSDIIFLQLQLNPINSLQKQSNIFQIEKFKLQNQNLTPGKVPQPTVRMSPNRSPIARLIPTGLKWISVCLHNFWIQCQSNREAKKQPRNLSVIEQGKKRSDKRILSS